MTVNFNSDGRLEIHARGVVWCVAGEDLKLDPNNPCYVQVRGDGKVYNSQTPVFSIGELKTEGKQGERVKVQIKPFEDGGTVLR